MITSERTLTADYLYESLLCNIIRWGEITRPRGFECKELMDAHLVHDTPNNNIIENKLRKINKAFAAAEMLWILSGSEDVDMVSFYNSRIAQYSDNGKTFFGAYGPKVRSQLKYIYDTLTNDPWSRQAVLNIWRENPPATKDVPCTIMFQFLRRPLSRLNMVVYMRSQDAWLGFPYDLHTFTSIQILLAAALKIEVGTFHQTIGSEHMYMHDLEPIEMLMKNPLSPEQEGFAEPNFGRSPNPIYIKSLADMLFQVDMIAAYEKKIRAGDFTETERILKSNKFDPFFEQKMQWMYNHAKRKYETKNS